MKQPDTKFDFSDHTFRAWANDRGWQLDCKQNGSENGIWIAHMKDGQGDEFNEDVAKYVAFCANAYPKLNQEVEDLQVMYHCAEDKIETLTLEKHQLMEEREKLREALEQAKQALNDEEVNSIYEKTLGLEWVKGMEASDNAEAALASLEKSNG